MGKSCTDELAFSLDGINVHYGTPVNPRFPDRLPGGSSSGSVSAVAAGLVDFPLGTDTSGSILAILGEAFDMVDERCVALLRAKVDSIQSAFAATREVKLGNLQSWLETFRTLKKAHGDWIRAVHPRFAPNIEASFQSASIISEAARRRALEDRARLLDTLQALLPPDALLCLPSAWTIAPLKTASAEELATNRVKDLTLGSMASLAGMPQVSVPVVSGQAAIGLGLLAAAGSDARLLALAERLAG